jgi:hypothetical protein
MYFNVSGGPADRAPREPVAVAIGLLATVRAKTLRTLLKGVPMVEKAWGVWAIAVGLGVAGVLSGPAYPPL